MVKKQKVQYTIEPIDIDGDNKIDGDLVTKYINGKVASRKFVPLKKLKKIVENAAATPKTPTTPTSRTPGGSRIVYKNIPDINKTDKPILVADQTGFGQYIKAGAGMEAGRVITDTVVDGISGLFSGDE